MRQKKQILIINDEPAMLKQMEKWLGNKEYSIACKQFGKEGVECTQDNKYDLILIDYHLKEADGADETARKYIPELTSNNPVASIVVTSASENELSAQNLGVSNVFNFNSHSWKKFPTFVKDEISHSNVFNKIILGKRTA